MRGIDKKKIKDMWRRLTARYNITLHRNADSSEVWHGHTSRLGFMLIALGATLVSGVFIYLLFLFTPLHSILPGYLDSNERNSLINNAIHIDSLSHQMAIRQQYIDNISMILSDDIQVDSVVMNDSTMARLDSVKRWSPDILTYSSPESEAFSNEYERNEMYNLSMLPTNTEGMMFYPPLQGVTTNTFSPSDGSYGIRIDGGSKASVSAILDGTIVSIASTINDSYIVVIQHNNNYTTVYKNIGHSMRKVGDRVVAGEKFAILGTAIDEALFFELWHNGIAINPLQYIVF